MSKRSYVVIIPVGGHMIVEVEANSPEEAKDMACDSASLDDVQEWQILDPVGQGNVLYFPSPWRIGVEDHGPVDEFGDDDEDEDEDE